MRLKKTFTFRIGSRGSAAADGGSAPSGGIAAEQFRPAGSRYRRRLGAFVLCAAAGILLSFVSLVVPELLLEWISVPGVALIALSLLLFFMLPALQCPACGKATDSGFDRFCPMCGKAALRVSRLWGTRCDGCGRSMGSYKYRNYRVRYCTHCGVMLDARGV